MLKLLTLAFCGVLVLPNGLMFVEGTIAGGVYVIRNLKSPSNCLATVTSETNPAGPVWKTFIIDGCGKIGGLWDLTTLAGTRVVKLRNVDSKMVLRAASKDSLEFVQDSGDTDARWQLDSESGYGNMINGQNGKCVDVSGGKTEPNSLVILRNCSRQDNQKWRLEKQNSTMGP